MLVAGEDDAAVHGVIDATRELAEIQASGAGGAALSAATKQRRATLEALVDRAVKALARSDGSAESKRPEIRQLVDQLSRHAELAERWIDATLRDVPEDGFGFGMFAGGVTVGEQSESPAKHPSTKGKRTATKATPAREPPQRDRAEEQRRAAERAERAQQARQARRDLAAARRDLATFERRVATARDAFDEAESRLRAIEEQRDEAQRRSDEAALALERLTAD